jgi:predicted membrane protein
VYINRTLLLLLAFGIVFIPSAQEWAIGSSSVWYRPFLIWAVVIAVAWWNQRKSYGDDL